VVLVNLPVNHGSFYRNLETQTLADPGSACTSPSALIGALLSSLSAGGTGRGGGDGGDGEQNLGVKKGCTLN